MHLNNMDVLPLRWKVKKEFNFLGIQLSWKTENENERKVMKCKMVWPQHKISRKVQDHSKLNKMIKTPIQNVFWWKFIRDYPPKTM